MSDVYKQLDHPPTAGLDRMSCGRLADEDRRILIAINARAAELFDLRKKDIIEASNALLAISELRELSKKIQASANVYRDAQRRAPNTSHRPRTS